MPLSQICSPRGWLLSHKIPLLPQGTLLLERCCPCWMYWGCTVRRVPETPWDQVCSVPTCGAWYCQLCWREAGSICLVRTPGECGFSQDSSEEDMGYEA